MSNKIEEGTSNIFEKLLFGEAELRVHLSSGGYFYYTYYLNCNDFDFSDLRCVRAVFQAPSLITFRWELFISSTASRYPSNASAYCALVAWPSL